MHRNNLSLLVLFTMALFCTYCDDHEPRFAPRKKSVTAALFNLDDKTRPQDDIYQYTNAVWLTKAKPAPPLLVMDPSVELMHETLGKTFEIINEAMLLRQTHSILTTQQKLPAIFVGDYMDTKRIEELGMRPLQSCLDRIDAIKNSSELASAIGELQTIGVDMPIRVMTLLDQKSKIYQPLLTGSAKTRGFYWAREHTGNPADTFLLHL